MTRDEQGLEQIFSDYKAREIFIREPKTTEHTVEFWANVYLNKHNETSIGHTFTDELLAKEYQDSRDCLGLFKFTKIIEVKDA